jgi:hypothetical protein
MLRAFWIFFFGCWVVWFTLGVRRCYFMRTIPDGMQGSLICLPGSLVG